ncbi:MAG: hypothetical protein ACRC4M_00430 [Mycoplasma sp.]
MTKSKVEKKKIEIIEISDHQLKKVRIIPFLSNTVTIAVSCMASATILALAIIYLIKFFN